MVDSNLDNNFAHGLIAFKVSVSIADVFPVEYSIYYNFEDTITLSKMIQHGMLVGLIAKMSFILQRASTKIGTCNLR